jgi:hypothetical protein
MLTTYLVKFRKACYFYYQIVNLWLLFPGSIYLCNIFPMYSCTFLLVYSSEYSWCLHLLCTSIFLYFHDNFCMFTIKLTVTHVVRMLFLPCSENSSSLSHIYYLVVLIIFTRLYSICLPSLCFVHNFAGILFVNGCSWILVLFLSYFQ